MTRPRIELVTSAGALAVTWPAEDFSGEPELHLDGQPISLERARQIMAGDLKQAAVLFSPLLRLEQALAAAPPSVRSRLDAADRRIYDQVGDLLGPHGAPALADLAEIIWAAALRDGD